MDMNQYLEIFIEESKEHLQSLNQSLLQLEKDPGDIAVLNEIFRAAHTLKGMSGTMGFSRMSTLTHDMEDVLHALRTGEIKANTALVDLLFQCLDALDNYLNSIIENGNEGGCEYSGIISALGEILKNKASPCEGEKHPQNGNTGGETCGQAEAASMPLDFHVDEYEQNVINKALESKMNVFRIAIELDKGCVLKSARAFIVFRTLEHLGEVIKSEPRVEDIEDEKFDFDFSVVVISQQDAEIFSKELNAIAEIKKVVITPLGYRIAGKAEGEKTEPPVQTALKQEPEHHAEAYHEAGDTHGDQPSRKAKTGKTVRVEIGRLDVLLNLVSELIIQKTRLVGLEEVEKSQVFTETLEYLERITTNLHDAVMKVRMVPVETVFNRFPRMIRDISKELGKEIIFNMSGEETELDRSVIDEIGDPLIHLLRNSIDHGIEPVERRRELGKPEAGSIDLRAYQDGNNVVIEVDDDGQGISLEKVKIKAMSRGLIDKDMADNLSPKDIIDFLFKPSFSTADVVTDISGRGVGLDVVKTKIEALGGIVEVETEMGKGSRFIIRLPLTLAIIQALLVQIRDEKYAIQLSSISQIIHISPEDIKLVRNQEVIMLRNTVIPIVRLDRVLKVPGEEVKRKQLTVVIVKKGERLSGFLVDKIIGQQEIVQKSVGKFLSGIKAITSATILGDGNVALILDVNTLAV